MFAIENPKTRKQQKEFPNHSSIPFEYEAISSSHDGTNYFVTAQPRDRKGEIKQRYLENKKHLKEQENIAEGVKVFIDGIRELIKDTGQPLTFEKHENTDDTTTYNDSTIIYKVGDNEILSQNTFNSPYDDFDYYTGLVNIVNGVDVTPEFVNRLIIATQDDPEINFSQLVNSENSVGNYKVGYAQKLYSRPDKIELDDNKGND